MSMDMADVRAVLPEIVLLLGAVLVLLTGSFLPRRRLGWTRTLTLLVLVGSVILAAVAFAQPPATVFQGMYAVDTATAAARLVAPVAAGLIIAMSLDELRGDPREAEICTLLLLATLGTILLSGATDLLVIVTAFLLASIPLYAIIGLGFTGEAAEAAMKTYLFGSLFGIVLMAGVTVFYGAGSGTGFAELASNLPAAPAGAVTFATVAVLGGLMFKAGGVPGHFWVPDAAQGSTVLAAAFLTTVPKVGALIAAYRLVELLPGTARAGLVVAVLAVASMTLGNLAAFGQDDPRRLLGWSTVSQVGYLLVPVAVAGASAFALPALLIYLAGYALTNVAAFAVLAAYPTRRTLTDFQGTARSHPWLAGGQLTALLGLVGTPPTIVFVGKLAVSVAAWDAGQAWLAVAVLANSVASLFYYLRWIAPTFAPAADPGAGEQPRPRPAGARIVVLAGAGTVVLGIVSASLFGLFGLT